MSCASKQTYPATSEGIVMKARMVNRIHKARMSYWIRYVAASRLKIHLKWISGYRAR